MSNPGLVRWFTRGACAAVAAFCVLAPGCGRTSLDDGFGAAAGGTTSAGGDSGRGGTGGRGASGNGGVAGIGGSAGAGGSTLIPCGASGCTPGMQACCSVTAGTQIFQSCVAANDPAACPRGAVVVACVDGSACASSQICCVANDTLAIACRPPPQCVAGVPFVRCAGNADCPAVVPRCCMGAAGSAGLCLPRRIPCP